MSPREKVVRGERDTKRKELEEETGGNAVETIRTGDGRARQECEGVQHIDCLGWINLFA